MKAIFIDGPSLHYMRHAMDIAQFNLTALNKFLIEEIGDERELMCRTITVTPAMGRRAGRAWRTAGFETLHTVSTDSADDMYIVQRIAALDPRQVKEVVLVSTDQDYIAALRAKIQQGVKVFWVGSSSVGSGGTSLMSKSLQPLLGTEFPFVDLLQHKERLLGLPKKMPPPRQAVAVSVQNLKIELSGASSQTEYAELLRAMARLLTKHPHIKYKIKGY